MSYQGPPFVSDYIDQLVDAICSRGFLITQDPDLNRWREAMSTAPGIAAVNPTFDPAHHEFERGGPFYWLRVTAPSDSDSRPIRLAAMIAFRLIDTGSSGSPGGWRTRSEEHTSELQSLMRISYAVFCLK